MFDGALNKQKFNEMSLTPFPKIAENSTINRSMYREYLLWWIIFAFVVKLEINFGFVQALFRVYVSVNLDLRMFKWWTFCAENENNLDQQIVKSQKYLVRNSNRKSRRALLLKLLVCKFC